MGVSWINGIAQGVFCYLVLMLEAAFRDNGNTMHQWLTGSWSEPKHSLLGLTLIAHMLSNLCSRWGLLYSYELDSHETSMRCPLETSTLDSETCCRHIASLLPVEANGEKGAKKLVSKTLDYVYPDTHNWTRSPEDSPVIIKDGLHMTSILQSRDRGFSVCTHQPVSCNLWPDIHMKTQHRDLLLHQFNNICSL